MGEVLMISEQNPEWSESSTGRFEDNISPFMEQDDDNLKIFEVIASPPKGRARK